MIANSSPSSNAALREGRYKVDLWPDYSGRTLAELGDEWKGDLNRRLAGKPADKLSNGKADAVAPTEPRINSLSPEEKAAGWALLFDGRGLDGWHTFGRSDVRPGWQIKNGALTCVDPADAGDLSTDKQYDWFELRWSTTSRRAATAESCFMSPMRNAPHGRPVRNFN